MQKIKPFLWFDGQAEEAMNFYVSIFRNSSIGNVSRFNGQVISGTFLLEGQQFMALNGGPMYKFTPAFSLFVDCEKQEEVDELWEKLTSGGGYPSRCGWLVDKFGVSWQIIPKALGELLADPDPARAKRAVDAMMQMDKIDIGTLRKAANGE